MTRNKQRRVFLRWMAVQLGALAGGRFLAACERAESTPSSLSPTAIPATLPAAAPSTPSASPPEPEPTITPTAYADLAVAREGDPEALVRLALAALGGMQRFVAPGADVIVKPNICVDYHTYEYAATTNPWVVGTVVKLCFEAGAGRVRVMDNPFGGTAERAYQRSGIREQVQAAGGIMEIMSGYKFVRADLPQGLDLRSLDIYDDILNADVVINVPIAKHHSLARLTLGMKNLMGTIQDRPQMHRNLGQRLADLASRVRPALTIIDAVRVLRTHGPTGGSLNDVQQMDTIIASPDIVAADSFAATLFGLAPADLAFVQAGASMGLGSSDLESLRIEQVRAGG